MSPARQEAITTLPGGVHALKELRGRRKRVTEQAALRGTQRERKESGSS